MKNKKTLGIIVAMALVAVLSVAGTLAYLQKSTGPVTNTFSASGLLDDDANFELKEHKAEIADADKGTGKYTLGTEEVTSNNYTEIVPGQNVDKDPFVRIKANALKTDAYLFIESLEKLPAGLTWAIDDTNWTVLDDVNPKVNAATGETATVYAYKINGGKIDAGNTEDIVVNIIKGKIVDVADTYEGGEGEHLDFYAYLTQAAGFDTAKAAWEATYGKTAP